MGGNKPSKNRCEGLSEAKCKAMPIKNGYGCTWWLMSDNDGSIKGDRCREYSGRQEDQMSQMVHMLDSVDVGALKAALLDNKWDQD